MRLRRRTVREEPLPPARPEDPGPAPDPRPVRRDPPASVAAISTAAERAAARRRLDRLADEA